MLFNNIIIYCLVGCSQSKGNKDYPYFDELKNFLIENHRFEQSRLQNVDLLIIPVNACSDCVDVSLEFAKAHHSDPKLQVVLLADRNKDLIKVLYSYKLDLSNVVVERKGSHNNFELGIVGPILLRLRNGQVVLYEALSRFNFEETVKKFGYSIEMLNK